MVNNATGALHSTGTLTCTATYTGENDPVPALLSHDDYATFSSLDLDFFLLTAAERIRNYCGWHIFPVLTHTAFCDMTGDGTITIPTTHLINIVSIAPTWPPGAAVLDPSTYVADVRGWVSFNSYRYGFAPTPNTAMLWPIDTVRLFDAYPRYNQVMVATYTHGFAALPLTVQEVAFELVMRTLEKPAGIASEVQAGPYRYKFLEFGMVLSEDQKGRLRKYRREAAS
jgi:hypothetical protein